MVLRGTDTDEPAEQSRLSTMAGNAFSSPFHFARLFSNQLGEPPVALRRRVLLERAGWQLSRGTPVTEAAWNAGYSSVEGFGRAFSRAFGRRPSDPASGGHWLPAPNGIHFHPPAALWVRTRATGQSGHPGQRSGHFEHTGELRTSVLDQTLISHDLDDTRMLIENTGRLPEAEVNAVRRPGHQVLRDGAEESIAAVLDHLVRTKEVWLSAIEGQDGPPDGADPTEPPRDRHDAVAARWLALAGDIDRRQGWQDQLVDALCDPPESFVLSDVFAHVLTFSAYRR